MMNLPYSYHTFLFPFIWNDNGEIGQDEFEKILSLKDCKHWFSCTYNDMFPPNAEKTSPSFKSDYALYQFLTSPARKLVFPDGVNDPARCYDFRYYGKPLIDIGLYTIEKKTKKFENGAEKIEKEVFVLKINGIKLKTYNTGVGIMVFELEYHGKKKLDDKDVKNEYNLNDINKINEYGRRINRPYVGTKEKPCVVTADKITITLRSEYEQETFEGFIGESHVLTHVMDPIKRILSLGSEFKLTSKRLCNEKRDAKTYYIYPAIDDRMFVCCLVRSDLLCATFSKYDKGTYEYLSEKYEVPSELYKFAFIETDCSCQSRIMRKNVLSKSVYDRWIDYGTIYAVTHHSLIGLTGEDLENKFGLVDTVVNPFLNIYVQLAIISLVQRATILSISAKASMVAGELFDKNVDKLEKIEELQKEYVRAHSQILLFEVTTQEQGVDIFQKLVDQLYIKENKVLLDEQMNNLRDVANIGYDRKEQRDSGILNKMLAVVSIFALVLAVVEISPVVYPDIVFGMWSILWGVIVTIAAALVAVALIRPLREELFGKLHSRRKTDR